jgi:hypothetical protein
MNENEEVQKQIEREMEERERDFSKLSEIKKYPKCGGELDRGYLDIRSGGALDVFFTSEKPSFWRGKGDKLLHTLSGEKVTIAHRCRTCRIVVFGYQDA